MPDPNDYRPTRQVVRIQFVGGPRDGEAVTERPREIRPVGIMDDPEGDIAGYWEKMPLPTTVGHTIHYYHLRRDADGRLCYRHESLLRGADKDA